MKTVLATIGYQGHDSESFLRCLEKANAEALVDVRWSARSRNRHFGKSALQNSLEEAGIAYLHFPQLGVPPDVREELKETGDFASFRSKYLARLRGQQDTLEELYSLLTTRTCCLMCMERRPEQCHRSVLAKHLSNMNAESISVSHLQERGSAWASGSNGKYS